MLVLGSIIASALLAALALGQRPAPARPVDREPHTLVRFNADGRPNPSAYETFPDYFTARVRQRQLTRGGRCSVLFHAETGEIRMDPEQVLGPFGTMSL